MPHRICRSVFVLALILALFLPGCPPPPTKMESTEKAAAKPELSIQIATLNFGAFNRRLEKKDVAQLASVLKREQVEILAIHGLVRYPNLPSRVDLMTELPAQIDMRTAFGEMINNSGKQSGNAVFSSFPILSQYNQSYDGVKSASFEAAFRTTIDAGVHSLMVVTASIPPSIPQADAAKCSRIITGLNEQQLPFVVTGNLASLPTSLNDAGVELGSGKTPAGTSMWYSGGILKPTSIRIVSTDIGPLLVGKFDIYRNKQP